MKKRFQKLLHHYKVEAFKISHDSDAVRDMAKEILEFTEQTLNNEFHYHFEQDPSPEQIERIKWIKSFTVEALLPPVIEKLATRIAIIEKQHEELVGLVGEILETLSDDDLSLGKATA